MPDRDAASNLPLNLHHADVTFESVALDEFYVEWITLSVCTPGQAILYFHGDFYIQGSLETDRPLAAMLAQLASRKVLQVAYRVAPEHPFPAAIYDGLAAYQCLIEQGYVSSQIALAGLGAGGGIVPALLQFLRDQGHPLPPVAASFSLWVDLTSEGINAKRVCRDDIVLSAELLQIAARYYM